MQHKQLTADEIQDVLNRLESVLTDLKTRWDNENPGTSWWKLHRTYMVKSATFIINTLDEVIQFVEDLIPNGTDKKASVMLVVNRLFDYIVGAAFPFWLKPFAGIIKSVVVDVIVDNMIEFIVGKYNAGYWKMETENGQETEETN